MVSLGTPVLLRAVPEIRGCAGRSGSSVESCVPAVSSPSGSDRASNDDDGVGQRDPGALDRFAAIGDDLQGTKAAGVPGVRAFDLPTVGVVDRDELTLRADLPGTAELVEQLWREGGVLSGIKVDRDGLGQVEPEPAQPLQGRTQQR